MYCSKITNVKKDFYEKLSIFFIFPHFAAFSRPIRAMISGVGKGPAIS